MHSCPSSEWLMVWAKAFRPRFGVDLDSILGLQDKHHWDQLAGTCQLVPCLLGPVQATCKISGLPWHCDCDCIHLRNRMKAPAVTAYVGIPCRRW